MKIIFQTLVCILMVTASTSVFAQKYSIEDFEIPVSTNVKIKDLNNPLELKLSTSVDIEEKKIVQISTLHLRMMNCTRP